MRVFLTGSTGFLGFHIARACLNAGHELLCLKRGTSQIPFDSTIKNIHWIDSDVLGWEKSLSTYEPEILIHSAWEGVSLGDRNNMEFQSRNIDLTRKLLSISSTYKQVIMLGSQAEYGLLNSVAFESQDLHPLTEYAKAKIYCSELLEKYGKDNNIEWQWIRVFSVYGSQQKENWIIPSVMKKSLKGDKIMNTTKGEQMYSFLYSTDFANAIVSVIGAKGKSGFYNLSSVTSICLRDLFLMIRELTESNIHFNFGDLEYRENQSMMVVGDTQKFIQAFGNYEFTSLHMGLSSIINEYKSMINESF